MVRTKYLTLNWLGECLSLSDSLRPAVEMVDLFPSCNHLVWVEIWLRDRDSHNWFYLFLL